MLEVVVALSRSASRDAPSHRSSGAACISRCSKWSIPLCAPHLEMPERRPIPGSGHLEMLATPSGGAVDRGGAAAVRRRPVGRLLRAARGGPDRCGAEGRELVEDVRLRAEEDVRRQRVGRSVLAEIRGSGVMSSAEPPPLELRPRFALSVRRHRLDSERRCLVYWVGHGGDPGVLVDDPSETGEANITQFVIPFAFSAAVDAKFVARGYRRMVVAIDACHAGVMGDALETPGVALLTGATPLEDSFATNFDPHTGIWQANTVASALAGHIAAAPDASMDGPAGGAGRARTSRPDRAARAFGRCGGLRRWLCGRPHRSGWEHDRPHHACGLLHARWQATPAVHEREHRWHADRPERRRASGELGRHGERQHLGRSRQRRQRRGPRRGRGARAAAGVPSGGLGLGMLQAAQLFRPGTKGGGAGAALTQSSFTGGGGSLVILAQGAVRVVAGGAINAQGPIGPRGGLQHAGGGRRCGWGDRDRRQVVGDGRWRRSSRRRARRGRR